MITSSVQQKSEQTLMSEVLKLSSAGGSIIQIRTREPYRASNALRKHLIGDGAPYREWDAINGWRTFTTESLSDFRPTGTPSDLSAAMETPLADLRNTTSALYSQADVVHYYVYVNPHNFLMSNPFILELISQYASFLPTTNVCMIMVTNDQPIQGIPVGDILVADFPTPTTAELSDLLIETVENALNQGDSFKDGSDVTKDDYQRIAQMGLGLSMSEFESYASITLIEGSQDGDLTVTPERLMAGIAKGKTQVIRQSEILELTATSDISEVGGMERLKEWVQQRAGAYSKEAREFGVEPPKGAALVGVPGTGKSLVAKAIASVFEVPLVRLDIARVFSKFVGDSESRMRSALKMVESMAPCVLFVDEIDKGLGGAGGGGDSGTSSRVLGSFLTWLQECKEPVFTMVTANRVDGLPPELLRRGRFDQIFSVGMPGEEARKEVLRIHLEKRKRSLDDYNEKELAELIKATQGYVPAEIESAIKDALTAAFSEGAATLECRHIVQALSTLVPMSKSHKEAIDRIVEWARVNATPVEYTSESPRPGQDAAPTPRTRRHILHPRSK